MAWYTRLSKFLTNLGIIPVMRPRGVTDDALWEVLPYGKGEINFVSREDGVLVQAEEGLRLDSDLRTEALGCARHVDDVQRRATHRPPHTAGRAFLASPQHYDLKQDKVIRRIVLQTNFHFCKPMKRLIVYFVKSLKNIQWYSFHAFVFNKKISNNVIYVYRL